MVRLILIAGIVAGVIVGAPMIAMMWAFKDSENPPMSAVLGYATMLVALSVIFLAVKRQRDHAGGGVIKFWPAFGMGLAISAVAGVIYVLAWEASLALTGVDFAGHYADVMVAQQRAKGVSGAELERFIAEMDAFRRNYANPLYRMPVTFTEIFPVGVLVSLISAALLRNSRFLPARRQA